MSYAETNFRSELIRYLNARLKLENEKIKQLTRIANNFENHNDQVGTLFSSGSSETSDWIITGDGRMVKKDSQN